MTAGQTGAPATAAGCRGVSVVVPTRGRRELVAEVVDGLNAARAALTETLGWDSEVIVVDDSPLRADGEAIKGVCARAGARYLRGPRVVASKRNLGVAHSRHDIVLFLDSDCHAGEDLLVEHVRTHLDVRVAPSGRPVAAVAGPVLVDALPEPAARTAAESRLLDSPFTWPMHYTELYWAATANLSVSRAAFESVGGFDDYPYTVVGGEDVDFGARLYEAGWTTLACPSALVRHSADGRRSLSAMAAKMFTYGKACVYNVERCAAQSRYRFNPVAALATSMAGMVPHRGRRWAGAATVGLVAVELVRLVARARCAPAGGAFGATVLDWAYQAGGAAEAVRRRKPWLAFRTYDYGNRDRFLIADRPLAGGMAVTGPHCPPDRPDRAR